MNTKNLTRQLQAAAVLATVILTGNAFSQSADALLNKLIEKGILTDKEADELRAEAAPASSNQVNTSKWKIGNSVKNMELYGDLRFRYEYRGAENFPSTGVQESMYQRERFRYAARLGIRGDLYDDWYFGFRLETSSNPRSTWVTFADDSNGTPSAKNSDTVNIGHIYLGWRPTSWLDITVGRMPNPLYTTSMIWDGDIAPEGAVERFKNEVGDFDLFANFGQFAYQDTYPDHQLPSDDTFMLAWQLGARWKLADEMSLQLAPVLYNYTGQGSKNGLNVPFSGQGTNGLNPNNSAALNQNGINDLLVLEVPAEFNFMLANHKARVFGDFAYNIDGADRARAAAAVADLPEAFTGENMAYMAGLAYGNIGLVNGQTSKKNTWEARAYWQHVEQYATDVNLIDSDFFEGRGNLQGVYLGLAYGFTDSITGMFRYGYANRINHRLDTGGSNPDLPNLNPIRNYHILQFDLTYRF